MNTAFLSNIFFYDKLKASSITVSVYVYVYHTNVPLYDV